MLLLSVLVGAGAGLAAVVLKVSVRWGQEMLQMGISEPKRVFALSVYPIIGITLTALFTKLFWAGSWAGALGPLSTTRPVRAAWCRAPSSIRS